jgi:hypothetical protein
MCKPFLVVCILTLQQDCAEITLGYFSGTGGIFGIHNFTGKPHDIRCKALQLSKKLRHRGPDWSGCFMTGNSILVHERLAIVGLGKISSSRLPS